MFEPNELMLKLTDQLIEELGLTDKEEEKVDESINDYMNKDSYQSINLIYYGEPKAQARARLSSNFSHFYDPDKSFKQFVNEQIRNQLGSDFKPISKEIYFTARYYKTTPKKYGRTDRVLAELGVLRPIVKPDIDNYEKLFYDALHGLLYTDDSVVIRGDHQKFYSCKPRVEVEILFKK